MKKLVITGLAVAGLALGACAQGYVNLDNSGSAGGFCLDTAGNYYKGTMGLEVWALGANAVPAGIKTYADLKTDGFTLEKTFTGLDTTGNAGVIQLGELKASGIAPVGASIVLGFAAWNSAATSFSAIAATDKSGILAFVNPSADYTVLPLPTPPALDGMTTDLVMVNIPEPSTFALAGLGAAALLIFRRRK